MEILLLLLLVVSAAALYVPEIIKGRALDSPIDTISDFRRGMNALGTSSQGYRPSIDHRGVYSASGQNEPEPYVRRSPYSDYDDEDDVDFIPYPSNKARMQMETRRQRILLLLWMVALATAVTALIPSIRWIIPLHIVVLLLLAGYTLMVVILPGRDRRR